MAKKTVKKTDKKVEVAEVAEVAEVIEASDPNEEFIFVNKGKDKYFTEGGPCLPCREVILTESQAAKYSGLVKQ